MTLLLILSFLLVFRFPLRPVHPSLPLTLNFQLELLKMLIHPNKDHPEASQNHPRDPLILNRLKVTPPVNLIFLLIQPKKMI